MKSADIIKVIAKELGSSDLAEINKQLKAAATAENKTLKFRITGKKLGHLGYTVVIKNIGADGIKIFDVNKVTLIKFSDIETFEKAKPKVPRPVQPKKVKEAVVTATSVGPRKNKSDWDDEDEDEDDDDYDDDEDDSEMDGEIEEEDDKKKFKRKAPARGGSSFIPAKPGKGGGNRR